VNILAIGTLGLMALEAWSIVDAVHVAKVNNLAFRDKYKISLNLQIRPCINTTLHTKIGSVPAGVNLKIRF
jgi:hypothetical protein